MRQFFDRFADRVAHWAAQPAFFVFCVLLIVLWAPSLALIGNVDTWQLIINTATTIITFLMVALLHNSQQRFEDDTDARLEEMLRSRVRTTPWSPSRRWMVPWDRD